MILCCKDIIEDWKIRVCDKKKPSFFGPWEQIYGKINQKRNEIAIVFLNEEKIKKKPSKFLEPTVKK